ncbi:MAG: hypothetical protein AB1742_12905, partial [bacterium]
MAVAPVQGSTSAPFLQALKTGSASQSGFYFLASQQVVHRAETLRRDPSEARLLFRASRLFDSSSRLIRAQPGNVFNTKRMETSNARVVTGGSAPFASEAVYGIVVVTPADSVSVVS